MRNEIARDFNVVILQDSEEYFRARAANTSYSSTASGQIRVQKVYEPIDQQPQTHL